MFANANAKSETVNAANMYRSLSKAADRWEKQHWQIHEIWDCNSQHLFCNIPKLMQSQSMYIYDNVFGTLYPT